MSDLTILQGTWLGVPGDGQDGQLVRNHKRYVNWPLFLKLLRQYELEEEERRLQREAEHRLRRLRRTPEALPVSCAQAKESTEDWDGVEAALAAFIADESMEGVPVYAN
jgi:hypothetical protein